MKKVLLLVCALFGFGLVSLCASELSYADDSTSMIESTIESSSSTITVYKISNQGRVVVSTKKTASYDSYNNTITVDGDTYRIQENPYYGESGKRGAYRYVAGGVYYFNL